MLTQDETAPPKPPSGYGLRAPRADEAAAVAELMAATEAAAGPDVAETTPKDVAADWAGIDPERDHWVVAEAGGALAAYGALYERGEEYPLVDVYVHPDHRGRGLGSFLVRHMEHDMRARLPSVPA
jgi:GNAT superfamily N-acetyltransferase